MIILSTRKMEVVILDKMISSKLQRKIYESKKARDILDEEFIEFLPVKRNINEFFNLYNSKFYNISLAVHKFFSEQSLQYVIDYINPKKITERDLIDQINQIQIDIDSIEKFHPIFKNNIVLQRWAHPGTPLNERSFYLIQSGRRRKIIGNTMLQKIKSNFRKTEKITKNWTIDVPSATISGISSGPEIKTEEDLKLPLYTINTGKELPSNIYTG
jgi:hypothetical protein